MPVTREFLASIGESFNSHDVDRIAALFHEDAVFLLASGPEPIGTAAKGRAAIRQFVADRFKRIPDMHWTGTDEWMGEDRRAVTQWRVTGNAVDGTRLDYQGCDLYEFKDGLIWRKDAYWKIVKPA